MIQGIGTDIIEIDRMRKALENLRFRERVFTPREIAYCESRGVQRAASYAARFAAKEAVLKAFGTGLRGGSLQEIEVLTDALGCPQIQLSGYYAAFAGRQGIDRLFISLSHSREYATAQCVCEGGIG